MIKIENINTFGWEAAIRGMRNPLNSWERSDSWFLGNCADIMHDIQGKEVEWYKVAIADPETNIYNPSIGPNDEKLMKALIKGGPVEAKFRRMIHVQMDITAPLYWWKEFDTYKVGTVANSCSTMHKIADKEFMFEDFSTDYLDSFSRDLLAAVIARLNLNREEFNNWSPNDPTAADKKHYWWQMIQLLPTSYNQTRTVDLSYEVLANIYKHRKNHKLDEWRDLCNYMKQILPYSWIFTEEWEDAPKKEPKKEEEKPTSGRFPWGNDPIPVNYKPTNEKFPRRNDAPDAMVYAIPYVEWVKKQKDRKEGTKVENPAPESKEADKDEVFALALIEAVGTLRERGYSNKEIRDMVSNIFGEE